MFHSLSPLSSKSRVNDTGDSCLLFTLVDETTDSSSAMSGSADARSCVDGSGVVSTTERGEDVRAGFVDDGDTDERLPATPPSSSWAPASALCECWLVPLTPTSPRGRASRHS